jgi:hypothetical protein
MKLTIGIPTFDDYDGVYFTIQSIRMYHSEILNDVEIIVLDNNPYSKHGEALRNFITSVPNCKVIPFTEYSSTFVKGKIFEYANTPYVMCVDSHVLLYPESIKKLITFFENGKDEGNLLHGPLLYDDMKHISTHFDLVWRGQMWGTWGTDSRGLDINGQPFEIPAQGMGLFACKKEAWLGFNPKFRGFGGEEGYIHEKYRKNGKKVICLPFLRWVHRFARPNGVPYRLTLEDKVKNYFIGYKELNLNTKPIFEHFSEFTSTDILQKWYNDVDN